MIERPEIYPIDRFPRNPDSSIQANASGAALDAFGRQRVSQVTTILDVKHPNGKNSAIVDEEEIGTGTGTHSTTNASVNMATAASADAVIRQTYQRVPYFLGKSQQFFFTFDNFQNETNIVKRVGCFQTNTTTPFDSDRDGLYLESSGSDYTFNVYKSGTQTASISRSSWDDPMDGSGPSGINLDFTKSQIFEIDFEYLGVGIVRFCFVVAGVIYNAHTYVHSNVGNSTYMTHSNQPIRYEIRQTGAGSGSMEMICATGGTEGSLNQLGINNTFNQGITQTNAQNKANTYALCGLRLDSSNLNVYTHITNISVINTTNGDYFWSVIRNPTVAGMFTYGSVGSLEGAAAAGSGNTVTGGTALVSGYGSGNSDFTLTTETALHLGVAIDGTRDEFILCVRPFVAAQDILGAFTWYEEL